MSSWRERGIEEGRKSMGRQNILDILLARFGQVSNKVVQHVMGVDDEAEHKRLLRQAVLVKTPADFLALLTQTPVPSPGPRLEELMQGVEELSAEERFELASYLRALANRDEISWQAEVGRRLDRGLSGQGHSREELWQVHERLSAGSRPSPGGYLKVLCEIKYLYSLEKDPTGEWVAKCFSLPRVEGRGPDSESAMRNLARALRESHEKRAEFGGPLQVRPLQCTMLAPPGEGETSIEDGGAGVK